MAFEREDATVVGTEDLARLEDLWAKLPEEVQYMIFRHLRWRTLFPICVVCKSFNDSINRYIRDLPLFRTAVAISSNWRLCWPQSFLTRWSITVSATDYGLTPEWTLLDRWGLQIDFYLRGPFSSSRILEFFHCRDLIVSDSKIPQQSFRTSCEIVFIDDLPTNSPQDIQLRVPCSFALRFTPNFEV